MGFFHRTAPIFFAEVRSLSEAEGYEQGDRFFMLVPFGFAQGTPFGCSIVIWLNGF